MPHSTAMHSALNMLLVGLGGFIGSVLRYLVTIGMRRWTNGHPFPHGTLVVNVIGCLLIGLLGGLADHRQVLTDSARLFLLVGLFGGFTTFSSFGYETFVLHRGQQALHAMVNVALNVVLGMGAVWLGYFATTPRG